MLVSWPHAREVAVGSSAPNSGTYPGVDQVQDPNAKMSLRLLWDRVRRLEVFAKGPLIGTLNPDTKPVNLSSKDTGQHFYASDFNRTFQWTGSVWVDDNDSPARFQIAFFFENAGPDPQAGWALCNGGTVLRSTSSGSTRAFTTPVIPPYNGQVAWMRL